MPHNNQERQAAAMKDDLIEDHSVPEAGGPRNNDMSTAEEV